MRWARGGGENGQVVPPLLVILLACLALGFMMLPLGLASDYKGRSQTAADAGALAGALNVKAQIEAAWAAGYQLTPEQVQWGVACADAAAFAARNNATLSSCTHEFFDIKIEVVGTDTLDQIGDTAELEGRSAEGRARATPFGMGGGSGAFPTIGLPAGGGGGGALKGAKPHMQKYADAAARFGLRVTSGLRVGDDGNHGDGNAIDVAAPMTPEGKRQMLAFARYAVQTWGSTLTELIHTPLGFGIKNGQQVPLSFWGSAVNADHYDHVHIADVPGGPGGPGGSGGGLPMPGGFMGGGFGLGLQVHLVRWDGKGTGLADGIPEGLPGGLPPDVMQKMYQIMLCESSNDPRATEPPGGNGGAYGHYGLFQFDPPTWASVGGTGDPRDASREEQWMRAILLYKQRGFQPWECASKYGYV